MNFTLDTNNKNRALEAYGEGYFQINGQKAQENLVLYKTKAEGFEHDYTNELLSEKLVAEVLKQKPDILIIGTGEKHLFPSKQLMGMMINNKIALEVMNTGAACRTYNVLLSEDRNCIAVLYLV